MRKILFLLPAAAVLAVPPAPGLLCTDDPVPAATILVPHFMVDLDSCGSGASTVVRIVNTVAASTLVHVTFWTDWSEPTIDYDIYLTGFDHQTIDLGDAFCNGNLQITGPTVSPHGELSDLPATPPDCENILPFGPNPVLFGALLDRIRNGHTGQHDDSFGGCAAFDHGDNVARGYLTIDVVERCSILFPNQIGYEDVLGHDNHILGEVLYLDPASNFFQSFPAVHVEATAPGESFQPGDHTFYGRYFGADALDRREPLASRFASRFQLQEDAGTELLVWRETISPGVAACGTSPPGFPLATASLLVFDEEENPLSAEVPIPLETNRVALADLIPLASGWLVFDGRHTGVDSVYGDDLAQAWLAGFTPQPFAISINEGLTPPRPPLPPLGLFSGHAAHALDNICAEANGGPSR